MWNCKINSYRLNWKESQLQFYRVVIAVILLCGWEDWAISRADGHIYETKEGVLRRAAGHTLWDEMSNHTI
jgi:hypothetical protein